MSSAGWPSWVGRPTKGPRPHHTRELRMVSGFCPQGCSTARSFFETLRLPRGSEGESPEPAAAGQQALSEQSRGRPGFSAIKRTELNHQPGRMMIKHVVLLAAALGLIAQSSVFAADPTPAPSPAMENAAPGASPSPTARKTLRQKRVERRHARRTGRHERREARRSPKTQATPAATATPAQ